MNPSNPIAAAATSTNPQLQQALTSLSQMYQTSTEQRIKFLEDSLQSLQATLDSVQEELNRWRSAYHELPRTVANHNSHIANNEVHLLNIQKDVAELIRRQNGLAHNVTQFEKRMFGGYHQLHEQTTQAIAKQSLQMSELQNNIVGPLFSAIQAHFAPNVAPAGTNDGQRAIQAVAQQPMVPDPAAPGQQDFAQHSSTMANSASITVTQTTQNDLTRSLLEATMRQTQPSAHMSVAPQGVDNSMRNVNTQHSETVYPSSFAAHSTSTAAAQVHRPSVLTITSQQMQDSSGDAAAALGQNAMPFVPPSNTLPTPTPSPRQLHTTVRSQQPLHVTVSQTQLARAHQTGPLTSHPIPTPLRQSHTDQVILKESDSANATPSVLKRKRMPSVELVRSQFVKSRNEQMSPASNSEGAANENHGKARRERTASIASTRAPSSQPSMSATQNLAAAPVVSAANFQSGSSTANVPSASAALPAVAAPDHATRVIQEWQTRSQARASAPVSVQDPTPVPSVSGISNVPSQASTSVSVSTSTAAVALTPVTPREDRNLSTVTCEHSTVPSEQPPEPIVETTGEGSSTSSAEGVPSAARAAIISRSSDTSATPSEIAGNPGGTEDIATEETSTLHLEPLANASAASAAAVVSSTAAPTGNTSTSRVKLEPNDDLVQPLTQPKAAATEPTDAPRIVTPAPSAIDEAAQMQAAVEVAAPLVSDASAAALQAPETPSDTVEAPSRTTDVHPRAPDERSGLVEPACRDLEAPSLTTEAPSRPANLPSDTTDVTSRDPNGATRAPRWSPVQDPRRVPRQRAVESVEQVTAAATRSGPSSTTQASPPGPPPRPPTQIKPITQTPTDRQLTADTPSSGAAQQAPEARPASRIRDGGTRLPDRPLTRMPETPPRTMNEHRNAAYSTPHREDPLIVVPSRSDYYRSPQCEWFASLRSKPHRGQDEDPFYIRAFVGRMRTSVPVTITRDPDVAVSLVSESFANELLHEEHATKVRSKSSNDWLEADLSWYFDAIKPHQRRHDETSCHIRQSSFLIVPREYMQDGITLGKAELQRLRLKVIPKTSTTRPYMAVDGHIDVGVNLLAFPFYDRQDGNPQPFDRLCRLAGFAFSRRYSPQEIEWNERVQVQYRRYAWESRQLQAASNVNRAPPYTPSPEPRLLRRISSHNDLASTSERRESGVARPSIGFSGERSRDMSSRGDTSQAQQTTLSSIPESRGADEDTSSTFAKDLRKELELSATTTLLGNTGERSILPASVAAPLDTGSPLSNLSTDSEDEDEEVDQLIDDDSGDENAGRTYTQLSPEEQEACHRKTMSAQSILNRSAARSSGFMTPRSKISVLGRSSRANALNGEGGK